MFIPKKYSRGQIYGGWMVGLGRAMTGACPGTLFAQIRAGYPVVILVLLNAIAGTCVYGYLRPQLPH